MKINFSRLTSSDSQMLKHTVRLQYVLKLELENAAKFNTSPISVLLPNTLFALRELLQLFSAYADNNCIMS